MTRWTLSAICAVLSLVLFPSPAQSAPTAGLGPAAFGTAVLSTRTSPYDTQWAKVQSQGLGAGADIAASARGLQGLERLRAVNVAVNKAIKFRSDSSNWGTADYWASAAETFRRGAGDCEDYAIAKMQVLRALGVPADDMFLVVGDDLAVSSAHAVLLVRSGGTYWVLNNLQDEVRQDAEYRAFRPIITLSNAGRWLHGTPAAKGAASRRAGAAAMSTSSLAAVLASQGAR